MAYKFGGFYVVRQRIVTGVSIAVNTATKGGSINEKQEF